jgi:hypothetical protein
MRTRGSLQPRLFACARVGMTYPLFNKEIWTHAEWACVLMQLAPSHPYELRLYPTGDLVRTENIPLTFLHSVG